MRNSFEGFKPKFLNDLIRVDRVLSGCSFFRFSCSLTKNRIVLSVVLLAMIFLVSCNTGDPPVVHAQSPNSIFQGRYWFHSRGPTLFEDGLITADGKGYFTLHSMYADANLNNGINAVGRYSLLSTGVGTEVQDNKDSSVCDWNNPPSCGDYGALFVSSDGKHAMIVSTEGPGQRWAMEMDRDPDNRKFDLSTCINVQGSVENCDDGWSFPPNWREHATGQ